ncbi:histidine decarboxylase [Streptomyces sp. NPDC058812]|uniref:histidine decarboxylase n=1 Tax=unclassified Streptomyces TaxID=2593676 RepID=UPI0036C7E917
MLFPSDHDLQIGEEGRTQEGVRSDQQLLDQFMAEGLQARESALGFPVNLDFDHRSLAGFLGLHANNVGSPHDESQYHLNTKPLERAVVSFFADLAGAVPGTAFGYVSNGGTESNIFGVYVGRERYPDAVLYASTQAHYSVPKIARLLRMDYAEVDVLPDAAMDPDSLQARCRENPGRAAVVVATIGTTGQGAVDDLISLGAALRQAGVDRFHLHADAAFGGPIAALGPLPRAWGFTAGADSIAISGHKMIGSPVPSGIVLARADLVAGIREPGVAVGADDDTISGSRDALASALLWRELRRLGRRGLADRVKHCVRTAEYAAERLQACGRNPSYVPGSNTVLFDAPSQNLCDRWALLHDGGRAHLNTMPHVERKHIDALCRDLEATQ